MPQTLSIVESVPHEASAVDARASWDHLQRGGISALEEADVLLCTPVAWPSRPGISRREEAWAAFGARLRAGATVLFFVPSLPEGPDEPAALVREATLATVRATTGLVADRMGDLAEPTVAPHASLGGGSVLRRLIEAGEPCDRWLRAPEEAHCAVLRTPLALATRGAGQPVALAARAGKGLVLLLPWSLGALETCTANLGALLAELGALRDALCEPEVTAEPEAAATRTRRAPGRAPAPMVALTGLVGTELFVVHQSAGRGGLQVRPSAESAPRTSRLLGRGAFALAVAVLDENRLRDSISVKEVQVSMREMGVAAKNPSTLRSYLSQLRAALRQVLPDLPNDALVLDAADARIDAHGLVRVLMQRGTRVVSRRTLRNA